MAATQQKVLESFQRFDADSSGAISRDELGQVLKALDEAWSDESIDQLLAQADASGDGQLQLAEFVSWVFAEDPNAVGVGAAGDFTLLISGCSREFLNGEYVQEKGRVYGGRPVFYCAANKRLLFYNKNFDRWQIFSKPGKLSNCRLYTKRAAHMPADAVWEVWQPKEKAFADESSVTCKILVPDRKEEIAKAPDIVRPMKESYGTYSKRMPWIVGKRPLYFCSSDSTFLVYNEKVQKWCICNFEPDDPDGKSDGAFVADRENLERDEVEHNVTKVPKYMKMDKRMVDPTNTEEKYDWAMIARLGLGFCFPIGWSEVTSAYSPEKATWYHPEESFLIEWEVLDATPNSNPEEGWKDPAFPPDEWSMGDPAQKVNNTWVRAVHLSENPVLFGEEEEPADALQGGLGNCGLVAALACLAEFPGYLSSLFITNEIPEDGKYKVKMFLPVGFEHMDTEKHWGEVELDDYLPCKKPSHPGVLTSATPMFTKLANGNKIYMPLLEKCFAKQAGNYLALKGYDSKAVWKAMTGCEETFCYTDLRRDGSDKKNPEWQVIAEGVMVSEEYGGQGKLGRLLQGATVKEVERKRYYVKFQKLEGEGPAEGWFPYYVSGKRTATRTTKRNWNYYVSGTPEEPNMFEKLVEFDQANYPMSSGPMTRKNLSFDGLVFPHAYTLLHAVDVNGFKMVCMRNPWGHNEWKGPWCDGSEEWKQNPEVAEALHVVDKDNGVFWMDWEDFEFNYGTIDGLRFSMPSTKASKIHA